MAFIYDYMEYREFLRDNYTERKRYDRYFSYRFISRKVGLDPGYLVRVFQGRDHVPERCVGRFVALFKLSREEAGYLRALMAFNKAKTQSQISQAFSRVMRLKSVERHCLESYQYEFYNKWFYSAVRALIGLYDFDGKNYQKLAQRLDPGISADQARKAVELLEKVDLIHRCGDGVYRVTNSTMISTGEKWRTLAVRRYQKETIDLAARSLEKQPVSRRDISTVTFTVARKDMEELRERISEFRTSLLSMARESKEADTVYQLNVQLFPLSKAEEKKK